jgi:hypothetical protein
MSLGFRIGAAGDGAPIAIIIGIIVIAIVLYIKFRD